MFPLAYDQQGRETYKLTLLSSGGSRQFNTDAIVARYDQRITMVVLADFILLGHEKVGSFALGASKIDLFTTAIQQVCQSIADVFNDHALPRLFRLNGMSTDRMPRIRPEQIAHVDLALLSEYLSKMVQAGAITVDEGLEAYLRELSNLPKKVSDTEGVPSEQVKADEVDDSEDEPETPDDEEPALPDAEEAP